MICFVTMAGTQSLNGIYYVMLKSSSLFTNWDGELLIQHYDKICRVWIFIAVHSSKMGPPTGGTRLMHYTSTAEAIKDVLHLSKSMTYKFAAVNFPRGGAKAVIVPAAPLTTLKRITLLERYGELLNQLNGLFYTGPDAGTSSADMDLISKTAPKFVLSCSASNGGAGSSATPTAAGVYYAMKKTMQFINGSTQLKNKTILVQGAGGVGKALIEMLIKDKAKVIVADSNESTLRTVTKEYDVSLVDYKKVYSTRCDIFSPCALGNILTSKNIKSLQCQAVVGAANNQLGHHKAAQLLKQKGILYAPDFIVNSGGAVTITGKEAMGWDDSKVNIALRNIGNSVYAVFKTADLRQITTEQAAIELAKQNLERCKE